MKHQVEFRFEKKVLFKNQDIQLVVENLLVNPLDFQQEYEPRWINNLYFDDINDSSLVSHWVGVGCRSKIRYRWYGGEVDAEAGQWELKYRVGSVGSKKLVSRASGFQGLPKNFEIPIEFQVPNEIYFPKLFNRYFRRYYRSRLAPIRATVDSDFYFSNPLLLSHGQAAESLVVLEYKFLATDAMAAFEIGIDSNRLDRFSKYVFGRRLLGF